MVFTYKWLTLRSRALEIMFSIIQIVIGQNQSPARSQTYPSEPQLKIENMLPLNIINGRIYASRNDKKRFISTSYCKISIQKQHTTI